jgi:hypothetical protein
MMNCEKQKPGVRSQEPEYKAESHVNRFSFLSFFWLLTPGF